MKHITDIQLESEIKSCQLVFVEFLSQSCHVCTKIKPYLEEVEKAYKKQFFLIDIDFFEQVIGIYNIKKLPTFVLFKNSNEVLRIVGFKSEFDFEKQIRSFLI